MPKKDGFIKKLARILITASLCCFLFGCEGEAQVFVVDLATPSPTPELVAIGDAPAGKSYSMTVLSPTETEKSASGQSVEMDSEAILLATKEPTATPVITPTAVPTVPPTPTPSPTPSPEPTPTPKATATPKATEKPATKPKSTATPKPVATPKPDPTPEPVPTDTPVPTAPPTPQQTSSQELPNVSSGAYNAEDILLAARVAYFEAGRTEEGYRAVLCVIVNRVESSKWPNSVYDVVYQKSQFTVVGRSDFLTKTIPNDVISYADDVFNLGNRLLPSNVMSFRSEHTDKTWGSRTFFGTYGGNDFYS